jgi:hypothetical protein
MKPPLYVYAIDPHDKNHSDAQTEDAEKSDLLFLTGFDDSIEGAKDDSADKPGHLSRNGGDDDLKDPQSDEMMKTAWAWCSRMTCMSRILSVIYLTRPSGDRR